MTLNYAFNINSETNYTCERFSDNDIDNYMLTHDTVVDHCYTISLINLMKRLVQLQ